jgi:Golgi phosphoprotein 3
MGRGPPADARTVALVCAAYAANVLDNALSSLSFEQRESCFQKADELLQEQMQFTEKVRSIGTTDTIVGVYSVYSKMDSII